MENDIDPWDDWVSRGSVLVENEKTLTAARLIEKIYENNCVGGNCHGVLDDYNIEDDSILWCIENTIHTNYHNQEDSAWQAEKDCMSLFLTMTFDERCSAIKMADY